MRIPRLLLMSLPSGSLACTPLDQSTNRRERGRRKVEQYTSDASWIVIDKPRCLLLFVSVVMYVRKCVHYINTFYSIVHDYIIYELKGKHLD